MIGLLAKLLADLKALADRLTSPWAAKLDALHTLLGSAWAAKLNDLHALLGSAWAAQLDVDVSSRAAASDYTAQRAAKLDNLDATILSRAAASDITNLSVIRSIQTGKVDTSTVSSGSNDEGRYVDVTITAVTTAKAVVLHQIIYGGDDSSGSNALVYARDGRFSSSSTGQARAYLTSATNLRVYSGEVSFTHSAFSGRWWVVEFK